MPKRRRNLYTPVMKKGKLTPNSKSPKIEIAYNEIDKNIQTPTKGKLNKLTPHSKSQRIEWTYSEVDTARGRLKGALLEVLEPSGFDSEASAEPSPRKRERRISSSHDKTEYVTDEEARRLISKSPPRESYVLKLFDRSVDLSQFREDSPLYPICRAWITNQPKANYKNIGIGYPDFPESVELPGPEGPPVSRIPDLLPEQKEASKDNINLNYREAPIPSREQLLRQHTTRWAAVRQAWLDQSALVEARYEGTQQVLTKINVEYLNTR